MNYSSGKLVRIGVFIDGGYFDEVSRYYKFGHDRGSRLSIEGVSSFLRYRIADLEKVDPLHCQVTESHYYRGRFSASDAEAAGKLKDQASFDDILIRSGVVQHYLPVSTSPHGPPKERGIEVELSLTAFERALHGCLDVVAMIGCDRDYVPLMRRLASHGVRTALLAWDFSYEYEDHNGRVRQKETRTSQALMDAATYSIRMADLIEKGSKKDGQLIDGLFV